jgi:hypothetical protein
LPDLSSPLGLRQAPLLANTTTIKINQKSGTYLVALSAQDFKPAEKFLHERLIDALCICRLHTLSDGLVCFNQAVLQKFKVFQRVRVVLELFSLYTQVAGAAKDHKGLM